MELPAKYSELSQLQRRGVRMRYVELQDGKCFWCGEPLSGEPAQHIQKKKINWRLFPPNFMRHPVHLQHDRQTDMTEGAVHARCNAVMWQYHKR